uniref:dTDP-glucose 4,6-dehydratase n=1 Tax=Loigolactobacillus rennini TaxID=238013 RepID=A0A1K2I9V6_9LACO|nr:dTDP-glucose 4,6-dehydratase [Loigolactobacillus rennini]
MDISDNYNFIIDKTFQKDINLNAQNDSLFNNLNNARFFVTGATGLIGHHLVMTLLRHNELKNTNIKIIAPVRNLKKAQIMYQKDYYRDDVNFIKYDIMKPLNINEKIDYIIHGASVTASSDFVQYPVQTIEVALEGTRNILELARQKNVKKMIYLSSLEVYGTINNKNPEICESDLGKIDILSPRSSYSESKRMIECLNAAYKSQYNVPVVNARLTQTFGSGVSINDSRVFAQFSRSVLNKEDITLNTDGSTARNYCDVTDVVAGLFTLLIKGVPGEAYNIANEATYISIKDMAFLVANKIANSDIKVIIDTTGNQNYGYAPKLKIKLMSDKIRSLGWQPQFSLENMFEKLIRSMKNRGKC